MFDLRQFVESNQSLRELVIRSEDEEMLTSDQVEVLHGAMTASRLKNLDIRTCKFANDGSLEQIPDTLGLHQRGTHRCYL
jgi:hypothetical protein